MYIANELNKDNKAWYSTNNNIKANNIEIPIMIMGIPNQKICDVSLKNFDLRYAEGKDYYDFRLKIPEQENFYRIGSLDTGSGADGGDIYLHPSGDPGGQQADRCCYGRPDSLHYPG